MSHTFNLNLQNQLTRVKRHNKTANFYQKQESCTKEYVIQLPWLSTVKVETDGNELLHILMELCKCDELSGQSNCLCFGIADNNQKKTIKSFRSLFMFFGCITKGESYLCFTSQVQFLHYVFLDE